MTEDTYLAGSSTNMIDQANVSLNNEDLKRKRISLNIRGTKYEIMLETLGHLSNSRLSDLKKLIDDSVRLKVTRNDELLKVCDDYDIVQHEYFFNRDPRVFNLILNCFSTGNLHIDDNICVKLVAHELEYWRVDETHFDKCCEWKYMHQKNDLNNEVTKRDRIIKQVCMH